MQLSLVGKNVVDLFNVLGPQLVLVLPLGKLPVGIDEENLVPQDIRFALVDHQHAGRNAGAVEEPRRQTDDRLDDVVIDEQLTDQLFLAAPEQDAVGHDGRHMTVGLEAGDHVLYEHQVGLLTALRAVRGQEQEPSVTV